MKSIFELKGAERAAALLVALGPETASEILKHLDEEQVERISTEIARIDRLSPDEREDLIGEFMIELKRSQGSVQGGRDRARDLLKEAFGEEKADSLLNKLSKEDFEKGFEFMHDIDSKIAAELLKTEQSQTIALTLSCIKPEKSADIIKNLPEDVARSAAVKIAQLGRFSPEAAMIVAKSLKEKYKKFMEQNSGFTERPGFDSLINILTHLDSQSERNLLSGLEIENPDISSSIRERIFTFENIVNLNNPEIRILIDEISDDELLALSLKGAGDEIRFKVIRNMSRNRASDILENMDVMGPVKLTEVQEARSQITSIMRRLHNNGEIDLRKDDVYIE